MNQNEPIQFINDKIVEAEEVVLADEIIVVEPELVDPETADPHGAACKSCGAPIENDDHYCPACGTAHDNSDQSTESLNRKYINCKGCGSTIARDPDQRSYRCGFCDSTYVVELEPSLTGRQNPEFIIGFAISKEQAQTKFAHWIKDNRWFRPGDLRNVNAPEKMTGIYVPFWSFSMLAESEWHAQIGEYWYRTETYTTTENGKTVTRTRTVTETEWWPLAGRFHHYYSGHLVSASKGLPQNVASQVMPFDLPALKRFEPYFLAGWESEEYTVERRDALEMSKQHYHESQERNVSRFMPGDRHSQLNVTTYFSQINSDLCLLPYYLLTYRYKEKLYRFVVNGQTGRVWGDKPYSSKRITAFVLILLLVIGLVIGGFFFLGSILAMLGM